MCFVDLEKANNLSHSTLNALHSLRQSASKSFRFHHKVVSIMAFKWLLVSQLTARSHVSVSPVSLMV